MDNLKNWDAGLMDDPPYEHDEKYEQDKFDDEFVETDSLFFFFFFFFF